MMKKEQKQVMIICIFLIIGSVLGYFVAVNQINQLSDPEYIVFWSNNNMPVPEPLGYTKSNFICITIFGNTDGLDFL